MSDDPPTLTPEDISAADYVVARLGEHDIEGVPEHWFERWLWAAHGAVTWRLHGE